MPPPTRDPVPLAVLVLIVLFVISWGPWALKMPAPRASPVLLTLLPLIVLRSIVRSWLIHMPAPSD